MGIDIVQAASMSTSRRTALKGVGAASLAALVAGRGLGLAAAQDATPSAGDYPTIAFSAKDYEFVGLPESVESGFTRLSMTVDMGGHHAMFVKLNDGVTADQFDAALQSPDLGPLLGISTSLGGPGSIDMGETATVVIDLTPGQYMVICLIPDEETGMSHAAMGMVWPLEVKEGSSAAAEPTYQGEIDLADFHFDGLPADLPAGDHVWKVSNVGEQLHELVVYKQAPGVPFSVVEGIFLAPPAASPEASSDTASEATPAGSPEAAGPPPFTGVTGVAPMNPGQVNYVETTLEAGDYFAICFIPDPATGAPHFALGMLMPFTVA